jgi:cis-3-alkyl-4-acyloxetan-2-one decarboxylase
MLETSKQEWKKEYPFISHYHQLEQGHKMHYIDEGEGPVVLLIHGNPTWSFYYRNLILTLKKNHRVIAPDHLGLGLSDRPQDYEYRLQDHINNLQELLNHLDISRYSLVVHDWGGPIGLGQALENNNQVEKLVILNTAAYTDKNIPKRIGLCKIPFLGEAMVRRLNAFAGPAANMAVKKKMSPQIKSGYLHPYSNYEERVAVAKFVQDIPMNPKHPSWETLKNVENNLQKIKAPKLILWGGKDFCFNKHYYNRWKEIYPEAQSHFFEKAGHYILEDAPKETSKKIEEFLH